MIDAYHQWLGIPKDQRPPTHYQLLGLSVAEQDRVVIEAAAVRQSSYVRNFQSGQYAEYATRILNEIAEARTTLLDPEKRKAYDELIAPPKLKKEVEKKPEPVKPAAPVVSKAMVEVEKSKPAPSRPDHRRPARPAPAPRRPGSSSSSGTSIFIGVCAVIVLAIAGWMLFAPTPRPKPKNDTSSLASTASNSGNNNSSKIGGTTEAGKSTQEPPLSERARLVKEQKEAFDAAVKQLEAILGDLSDQVKADNGFADYKEKVEQASELREKDKIDAMIKTAQKLLDAERAKLNPSGNPASSGNDNNDLDPITAILKDVRSTDYNTQRGALDRLVIARVVPERKEEVAEALNRLLEASDTNKSNVIKAMGYWGNDSSADLLCRICDEDQKSHTKEAMRSLAKLKMERGVKSIFNRLWDRGDSAEAAKALKDIGQVAETQVWELLKNKDFEVRGAGCEILSAIGTSQSLSKIKPLLNDKDKRVKDAAKNAMNRIISRESAGKTPEKESEQKED